MKTLTEIEYKPSLTYYDVLWLRSNYAPAKMYWDRVRKAVKEREGGLCQVCKNRGTEVHHEVYSGVLFHEHLWVGERNVLMLLCRDCHQKITEERKSKKTTKKWWKW